MYWKAVGQMLAFPQVRLSHLPQLVGQYLYQLVWVVKAEL
jgi:hypothetical protein